MTGTRPCCQYTSRSSSPSFCYDTFDRFWLPGLPLTLIWGLRSSQTAVHPELSVNFMGRRHLSLSLAFYQTIHWWPCCWTLMVSHVRGGFPSFVDLSINHSSIKKNSQGATQAKSLTSAIPAQPSQTSFALTEQSERDSELKQASYAIWNGWARCNTVAGSLQRVQQDDICKERICHSQHGSPRQGTYGRAGASRNPFSLHWILSALRSHWWRAHEYYEGRTSGRPPHCRCLSWVTSSTHLGIIVSDGLCQHSLVRCSTPEAQFILGIEGKIVSSEFGIVWWLTRSPGYVPVRLRPFSAVWAGW